MPRYIDADALITSLAKDRSALVNNHVPHGELHRIDETIWKVVEAPTADVVPVVRGEWKNVYKSGHKPNPENVCSECDCWSHRRSNFCPNCGADNRGGEVKQ